LTDVTLDVAALLHELSAVAPEARPARLRAAGPVDDLLVALGDQAERMATVEAGQAVTLANLVVALADETGGARSRARAHRALAQSLAYSGRFVEALAACHTAAVIAGEAGAVVEAARARLASLHALASLGRFGDALAAGEAARQAFLDAGEPELAARADLNLGAVQAMRDDPRAALVHLDRARPLLSREPVIRAQLETNRGNALMSLDDFAGAEAAFQAAAADFAAGGQRHAAAIAEGNLAYLATRRGLLPTALAHFERARRALESDESRAHLARLQAEQAAALAILGLPADALAAYREVIPTLDAVGLAVEAAQAHAALGGVLLRLGRIDEARTTLADAARRFDELEQPVGRARVDLLQAELLLADGQPGEARRHVESALAALGDRADEQATAQALLARIAFAQGEFTRTDDALRDALSIAEDYALAPVLADLYHTQGLLARARGNLAAARKAFRAAIAAIERVRGTLQAERFRAAYLGDRLAVYSDLASAALAMNDAGGVAEAFAVIEQSRSRALLDVISGAFAEEPAALPDEVEAPLVARLATVRAELNWHYSRLAETGPGAVAPSRTWKQTVRAKEEELERLHGRLAMTRRTTDPGASPVDLADMLAALPNATTAIAYFATDQEFSAFVLRGGGRVYRGLATIDEVTERVRRFRFQIARALAGPPDDRRRAERILADVRRELRALDALLLAPLRGELRDAEQIAVVPHGSLHAIPFHALWDGERYLIEWLRVVVAPSSSLLVHLGDARREIAGAGRAVVVGVPDALTPQIPAEVAGVAAALGAVERLEGVEATADRFAAAVSGASLVHFAGHGRFSPADPATAGLKLADRWITPRDLAALHLRGAHVTLSGCDTGRTAVSAGDEVMGLIRGLLTAGASSLLVSLWPAHDASTAELMADFYRRRQSGLVTADAWCLAQRAAIARHPHPAIWAPFVAIGGFS
jgi:tetratricopeptide (TPR) repeat protein